MSFDPTNPTHVARRTEEPLTQLRAATALLALVQEDAPAAEWALDHHGHRLVGQLLPSGGTDADLRRGLIAWQRVIGAGPVSTASHMGADHISVEGSYEGIPVRVVTIVDAQSDLERKLTAVADGLGEGESLTADQLRELLGGEAA